MPPEASRMRMTWQIAAKEIALFFASPTGYLFLATFAAIALFAFFWGEAFFARNIADVRPLFEWMPILLIFLCSALTMRLWSEERRTGTLEHVLTQPVPLGYFVAGKFLACLVLLGIALAVTLPLPLTVALIGDLDWGPVFAGYLATLLLGAAYLSVGLFVSSRSDNQIVSMISATALCGALYLVGSGVITDLFTNRISEVLRLIGTGTRFESITRGVIDLRDLAYYLSIVVVFLVLNAYMLERERWAHGSTSMRHRRWQLLTVLLIANALVANLWLGQLRSVRIDATEGNLYSISPATQDYLDQLREPLLLRGYFSNKTHPLLAPLVPRMRDLLREYEVAGNGNVRVEFVDPLENPELEAEANQKYGIQSVPFQVADRYQAAIVSSYFNVLVEYGDEFEILGFDDLIEVSARSETDIDVLLRNPEYDLTRTIRKVLNSYQAGGNLFDTVKREIRFIGYVSADDQLPEPLVEFRRLVEDVVRELQAESYGRLEVDFLDPAATDAALAQQLEEQFGFKPMTTSLLSDERFYFYLTLGDENQVVQIPLDDLDEDSLRRNLKAAIKRFASGFTKTLGLAVPPGNPQLAQFGMGGVQFSQLESYLATELNVERVDTTSGRIPGNVDVLLVLAPEEWDETQVFALDQFLMQGGTVVLATSPFKANLANRTLSVSDHRSGLEDWLSHHGLSIGNTLVMDPQNAAFPVPVTRDIGGFQVQELRMLDYPYFVDVRSDGLNGELPVTADLQQLTMAWASPIETDADMPPGRKLLPLVESSAGAWLSASTNVMPRIDAAGLSRFEPEGETGERLLGVAAEGRFESFFAGRPSPLASEPADDAAPEDATPELLPVIERSPESARLVLFSSNDFLNDQVVQLAGAAGGVEYLNPLQLISNTVEWSLEDSGLLSIRSRGNFSRTLPPMDKGAQQFWEILNYALALFALGLVMLAHRLWRSRRNARYAELANDARATEAAQ